MKASSLFLLGGYIPIIPPRPHLLFFRKKNKI